MSMFQSAPPHGGRRADRSSPSKVICFNPRPRTGGDLPCASSCQCGQRFNPRPRTGGDLRLAYPQTSMEMFQSAPPHGGRRLHRLRRLHRKVSIRAPARGATDVLDGHLCPVPFQSAPPHGGRLASAESVSFDVVFQSAPPHGGRPAGASTLCHPARCFNPRPRTGGDTDGIGVIVVGGDVSIRAPARGATLGGAHDIDFSDVSIRAPARGATVQLRSVD